MECLTLPQLKGEGNMEILTLNLRNIKDGMLMSVTSSKERAINTVADSIIMNYPKYTLADYVLYQGRIQDNIPAQAYVVGEVLDIIERIQ